MSSAQIFVYGTLLVPEITSLLLGRVPNAEPAILAGYRRRIMRNEVYPAVVPDRDGAVPGLLYLGVRAEERRLLDAYEGEAYELTRVVVTLGSQAADAHTYVLKPRYLELLGTSPWELRTFIARDLPAFRRELEQ